MTEAFASGSPACYDVEWPSQIIAVVKIKVVDSFAAWREARH
ncbi:hypothetical protein RSAG8_08030, partial [Rhizoctonia solani AG-8 WAC10335]